MDAASEDQPPSERSTKRGLSWLTAIFLLLVVYVLSSGSVSYLAFRRILPFEFLAILSSLTDFQLHSD